MEKKQTKTKGTPQPKNSIQSSQSKSINLRDIQPNPLKYGYLFKNVHFTNDFYTNLTKVNQRQKVLSLIDSILSGHFDGIDEQICYENDFLYGTYFYSFPDQLKLLFVIYFKESNKELIEQIDFLNVSSSVTELKSNINSFVAENKYSTLSFQFDRTGLLKESDIFFESIEMVNGQVIKYPFNSIDKSCSEVDSKSNDLDPILSEVCKMIEQKKNLDFDTIFHECDFPTLPSCKEKILVKVNKNIIISGRPGTGKTYIILLKTLLLFLNCFVQESLFKVDSFDKELISEMIKEQERERSPEKKYKVVFTSLSQVLCTKVEEMFSNLLKTIGLNYIHKRREMKEILNLKSFKDINAYPLFVNFRKIIFLIDASINRQFFDRPIENKLVKKNENCDILYCENEIYKSVYQKHSNAFSKTKTHFYTNASSHYKVQCKEVDSSFFIFYFSSRCLKDHLDPNEVYSQIISVIKGSLFSYLNPNNGLSRYQYHQIGVKLAKFNESQRNIIYDIFLEYEQLKETKGMEGEEKVKYFDFQDVVNYLIREVTIELVPSDRKLIDFLFVDEVQDFSINQLYLMHLVTRNIKVLAGDTCQTISKSNRFRFCDLNGIYYTFNEINSNISIPQHVQIILNFRCNSKIIKLAHLVFALIFKYFPETLDKVKLDFSTKLEQIRPCLINDLDLFFLSFLDSKSKEKDDVTSKYIQFGFKHCFLCKTESSALELRKKYNVLALSVAESKGLEYEIVILYNFFKDSFPDTEKEALEKKDPLSKNKNNLRNLWSKILVNTKFIKKENPNLNDYRKELELEQLPQEEIDQVIEEYRYIFSPEMTNLFKGEISSLNIFPLCSELKELYVGITRAKSIMFIYEEDTSVFLTLKKILNDNELIEEDTLVGIEFAERYLTEQSLTREQLKAMAHDEYTRELYQQAEYHFGLLRDRKMENQCNILHKYKEIRNLQNSFDSDKYTIEKKSKELLEQCKRTNFDEKDIKGELMENVNDLEGAYKYFKNKHNNKKCGLICMKRRDYKEAINYFQKSKEHYFVIQCYAQLMKYSEIFDYIHKITEKIDYAHYIDFYCKYANKYLENYDIKLVNFNFEQKVRDVKSNSSNLMYYQKGQTEKKFLYEFENFKEINLPVKTKGVYSTVEPGINKFECNFYDKKNPSFKIKTNGINQSVFQKIPNEFNITKTTEEINRCKDTYKELLTFICTFVEECQNKKWNYDESIIKFINLKNQSIEINNKISNQSDIRVLNQYLKLFQANETVQNIYSTQVLKIELILFFIKTNPLLFIHKRSQCTFINKHPMMKEMLIKLVELSKKIGLDENEMSSTLRSALCLTNHYEQLLPLLPVNKLIIYSSLLKKRKLLVKSLNELNVSFNQSSNQNLQNNYLYIFNGFLSTHIVDFLDSIKNIYIKNEKTKNTKKIVEIVKMLKPYPAIFSIFINILENSYFLEYIKQIIDKDLKQYETVPISLYSYLKEFDGYLEEVDKKTNIETMRIIEIGNVISLILLISSLKSFGLKWVVPKESSNNLSIVINFLVKVLERVKNFNSKEYPQQIAIFSLFSSFGISLIPRINEFEMYSNLGISVITNKSILFWESEYFNIYSISRYIKTPFDSSGKHFIVSYNNAYSILVGITCLFTIKLELKLMEFFENSKILPPFNISNKWNNENLAHFFFKESKQQLESLGEFNSENIGILQCFINSFFVNPELGKQNEYYYPFYETNQLNFSALAIIFASFSTEYEKRESKKITNIDILKTNLKRLYISLYDKYSILKSQYNSVLSGEELDTLKKETYRMNDYIINYYLLVQLIQDYSNITYNESVKMQIKASNGEPYEDLKNLLNKKLTLYDAYTLLYNSSFKISPLLKILWLKRIYTSLFVLIKEKYRDIKDSLFFDSRTKVNYTSLQSIITIQEYDDDPYQDKKLFKIYDLLNFIKMIKDFILKNLPFNRSQVKLNEKNNYYYYTWLRNYFEYQLYLIIFSLTDIKSQINNKKLCNKIDDLDNCFRKNSLFYYNLNVFQKEYFDMEINKFEFWFYERFVENEYKMAVYGAKFIIDINNDSLQGKDEIKDVIQLSDVIETHSLFRRKAVFQKDSLEQLIQNFVFDKVNDNNKYIDSAKVILSKFAFE